MSLVDVENEWDPLEEVIIGTVRGARVPRPDPGLLAIEFTGYDPPEAIPTGSLDPRVVEETEAELEEFCEVLISLGVVVRRPEPRDIAAEFCTPDWRSDGLYDYCPRDCLLTVGTTVIETPMVLRSRLFETLAYRPTLLEYLESGSRWIAAPKPRLLDAMYDGSAPRGQRLKNLEPAFDAANVLRLGHDLLYLVSDSGNELGARWLQSTLGAAYRVYLWKGVYASTHIDSTVVPLREGLVLLNPARVNKDDLPPCLAGWETLYAPELVDTGYVGARPRASVWIGMNLLVVRPGLVVADKRQVGLIRLLERHDIEVLSLQLTHARTLGGGFHCVSLDVRRDGGPAFHQPSGR